jgi:hypothetical protein
MWTSHELYIRSLASDLLLESEMIVEWLLAMHRLAETT